MTLTEIVHYPIKSCRGIRSDTARVKSTGLEHDRLLMVVEPDGSFLTQRRLPRMALITAEVVGGELTLTARGMNKLRIALRSEGSGRSVRIWEDECFAVDQDPLAGDWLSEFLGRRCVLVHQRAEDVRPVDADFAVTPHDVVSFADGFPLLLTTEESLHDLNQRLSDGPLPMDRFRPNLVVRGAAAFAEDGWKKVRVGQLDFAVVKPCARCLITEIDQKTGRKGREPLRTLATYRLGSSGGALFGQNLIPLSAGEIRVGDRVTVVA